MARHPVSESRICSLRHKHEEVQTDLKIANILIRLDSMDKALMLHAQEMERRLEGLNQLREDVVTDRAYCVRKESYDSWVSAYERRHEELVSQSGFNTNRMTKLETSAGIWNALAAEVKELSEFRAGISALASQKSVYGATGLAIASLIVSLIMLLMVAFHK